MDIKIEEDVDEPLGEPSLQLEPGEIEEPTRPAVNPFRVDVSLIPQAESKDVGVLGDLGLQVFNQADLEAGVIAQAEQRMEERSQVLQAKKTRAAARQSTLDGNSAKAKVKEESAESSTSGGSSQMSAIERYFADQKRRAKEHQKTAKVKPSFVSFTGIPPKKMMKGSGGQGNNAGRGRKRESVEEEEEAEDSPVFEDEDAVSDYGEARPRKSRRSNRTRDDANSADYIKRVKAYREVELLKRQEAIEAGVDEEEEYISLSEGMQMPRRIWSELYQYQKTGVKWMWELHKQEVGGILGDEMGLGKTIQIIAFLAGLQYSNLFDKSVGFTGQGPVLIVCPATVLHQWVAEFHKWWPPARVAVLHASGSHSGSRASLVNSMVKNKGILLTTYQGLLPYQDLLIKQKWHYVVLDEGHKIRNPDSQVTVVCKQLRTPHRLILSGSPMQNNLKELWSLFDFIFPGKLGLLNVFLEQFSVPIIQGTRETSSDLQVHTAYKCATALKDTITPYLLRRSKDDVKNAIQLPEKNEQVLFCQLTEYQRQLYEAYLNSDEIRNVIHGQVQIFIGLMQLRKLCNHPDIFDGGPKVLINTKTKEAIIPQDEAERYGYWRRSGKMIVVEALLKMWNRQKHKVLIFSQSRKMLDIIGEFMENRHYSHLRMDGTTAIAGRQTLIKTFNEDPDIFAFLLTTRVGGLGVNLTGANRVLIFDPDWNPSTDTQARERAWRIGQSRPVTIYRLLCAGTIEEKIYHRQIFKQYLTNRVLKDPKQKRFFKHNDLYELFTLSTPGKEEQTETGESIGLPLPIQEPSPGREPSPSHEDPAKARLKEIAKAISKKMAAAPAVASTSSRLGGKAPSTSSGLSQDSGEIADLVRQAVRRPVKKSAAAVEGEHIAGLAKQEAYCSPLEETAEETKKKEDYVLKTLFKTTTAHSAVPFEDVASGGSRDHAIVEEEAQRVAQEAMRILRLSRKKCHDASSGIPNYSGDFVIAPPPPLVTFSKSKTASLNDEEDEPLNAMQLLASIRQVAPPTNTNPGTNEGTNGGTYSGNESSEEDEDASPTDGRQPYVNFSGYEQDASGEAETFASPTQLAVAEQLVAFLNHDTLIPGQATTEVLVKKFQPQLPVQEASFFRAILRGVCHFEKKRGGRTPGVWTLKHEYRDFSRR